MPNNILIINNLVEPFLFKNDQKWNSNYNIYKCTIKHNSSKHFTCVLNQRKYFESYILNITCKISTIFNHR